MLFPRLTAVARRRRFLEVSPARRGLDGVADARRLVCGARCLQPARVGGVYRIIVGERIGVGGGSGAWDEERVAADEAADRWVVEARAELGDAERGERVAAVPLLVAVKLAARFCARPGPR